MSIRSSGCQLAGKQFYFAWEKNVAKQLDKQITGHQKVIDYQVLSSMFQHNN